MHHPHHFLPRSRLVAIDPLLWLRMVNDAAGFEPVARQLVFPVDTVTTPAAYRLTVDVPGITREQIHIEVVEQQLTLTIDKAEATVEGDLALHHRERRRPHGRRQFKLPSDVQADQIQATLVNGVLTLTLPRRQPKAPPVHTVTIVEEAPPAPVSPPSAE